MARARAQGEHMVQQAEDRQAGESALKQARRAAKRGDLAAAEKWSKLAERMARAAEKLAAAPAPIPDYQEEERLRAEIRERLGRYVAAAKEVERWQKQRDAHEAAVQQALASGAAPPPPLPPSPYSMLDLDNIVREGDGD
jgi:hypothetical protein